MRLMLLAVVVMAAIAAIVIWPRSHQRESAINADGQAKIQPSAGPPWIYGRSDARFTLIEYADLECVYCREYFPRLRQWIQANPDVNWQWHHLPLAMHEPAATNGARLAECAGETTGVAAFWEMVSWIYQNSHGGGSGLEDRADIPGFSPELQACIASNRPDVIVQAQADAAAQIGVTGTPTLRLDDRKTGKTITLHGAADEDALSSALDFLSAPSGN